MSSRSAALERREIVARYDRGRDDEAKIDPWEDPQWEIYHKTDRFGFIHDQRLPLIRGNDNKVLYGRLTHAAVPYDECVSYCALFCLQKMIETEMKRVDKWVKMLQHWDNFSRPEQNEKVHKYGTMVCFVFAVLSPCAFASSFSSLGGGYTREYRIKFAVKCGNVCSGSVKSSLSKKEFIRWEDCFFLVFLFCVMGAEKMDQSTRCAWISSMWRKNCLHSLCILTVCRRKFWSIDWLIDFMVRLIDWYTVRLIDWLIGSLIQSRLIDRLMDWLIDCNTLVLPVCVIL